MITNNSTTFKDYYSAFLKLMKFDGKKENWPTFEEMFLARAKLCGFCNILLGKTPIPENAKNITNANKIVAQEANIQV